MRIHIIVRMEGELIKLIESVWDTYELAMAEQRRLEKNDEFARFYVLARDVNQRVNRPADLSKPSFSGMRSRENL